MDNGDEVVISGISGRFPESNNFAQFRDNLLNKVDMITDDGGRWQLDQRDVPRKIGKINNIEKFDADFFDCNFKQAHTMDPQGRMLLEHAYEAIVDAGVNPKYLKDTNTGVFTAICFVESEFTWIYQKHQGDGLGMIGTSKSMLANRLSGWLGVKGPSYNVDSACSSSLYAMEHAYRAIKTGLCNAAIVCGSNLCLHPNTSIQYARLGVLSPDGHSKSFDNNANGYVRSETIAVAYLQKAKNAKRVYATVVHAKTNCDGFKSQGITFPSSAIQSLLLKDVYAECQVPLSSVAYFEAHGTGTKVGDPEELTAIESVFRPKKEAPLIIGAVKSNMGHAEAAAGMAQISKIIIANESGIIPPNLHYKEAREEIKALQDGRLKVISEPTPWNGGYSGISSFGFGGANAHVVLKSNSKEKVNGGAPQDDLPRLVAASGRTEEAVESILTDVETRPVDVEYIRLLQDLHAEAFSHHPYRGYTIIGDRERQHNKVRNIKHYPGTKRPVWFVFSGMSSQWLTMRPSLLRFQVFANTINRCHVILKRKGIDLHGTIMNPDGLSSNNIVRLFVGMAVMQIGLVDLLKALGIVPDGMIGHAFGELGCAYADGSLTAEQVILTAYSLAQVVLETPQTNSSMATVNLSSQELENLGSSEIEVVWHNSVESSTIAGPTELIQALVARLTAANISAQKVSCSTLVYSARYMADIKPQLLAYLKEVIPHPRARSSRWLSTSIPESQWNTPLARLSSAQYHSNHFLSPVLFAETTALIPQDAVIIEVAPHSFLQDLLQKSLPPGWTVLPLIHDGQRDDAEIFLQAIGELYEIGCQPEIWRLYPEVKFPVSRGTPMISPLVMWDHSEDWFVNSNQRKDHINSGVRVVELSLADEQYEYIAGHIIDGRNVIPATAYLTLVWEALSKLRGLSCMEMSIVFEDVDFLRATTVSEESVEITIMIQKGTGRFEITEGGVAVATGVVHATDNPQLEQIQFPIQPEEEPEELDSKDVYKELWLRGYQYSGLFRAIKSANLDGTRGTIRWNSNWVTFMDNMLQMMLVGLGTRNLMIATRIQKLVIDPRQHSQHLQSMSRNKPEFKVFVNRTHATITSGGIQIRGLKSRPISRRRTPREPVLETHEFVCHRDRADMSLKEVIHLATHLVVENTVNVKVKVLEPLEMDEIYPPEELLSFHIAETLADLPTTQADLNIITPQSPFTEDLPYHINVVEPKIFTPDTNVLILVGRDLLSPQKALTLRHTLPGLRDGGFVFTVESQSPDKAQQSLKKYGLHVIFEKVVDRSTFWVLRKIDKIQTFGMIIPVDDDKFNWFDTLKEALKIQSECERPGSSRVFIISDKISENGLLGLVQCLRKEPGGEIIRGVLIQDPNAPNFSLSDPLFADQLKLDLAINVLRSGGTWGSYRHLRFPTRTTRLVHHAWVKQLVRGDLSSFRWMEGPVTWNVNHSDLVRVVYSSINFKDIMIATGKLTADNFNSTKIAAEYPLGFEYSGITTNGTRVMGIVSSCALTNILHHDATLTWTVPDSWTLDEAATVPCAYATCCYALFFYGKMKKGDKILIHAGSGGVGQAAINLALSTGCEIFTTVGTDKKRVFIRKTFPQIPEDHIGKSRDTSFEQLVMNKTNGMGVDIVLNSLADDKLQASVRCLAQGGRFLEIGKVDIANNSSLGMSVFSKGIGFYGILLEKIFGSPLEERRKLHRLVQRFLDENIIKPLNFTIFNKCDIESAFKYMAAGKHIGKVILEIQDERNLGTLIAALPQYHCRKDHSYVILGGLGGFGLELAHWLILRGAQYIILSSHGGVKNGYQRMRIKRWRSSGVKVTIITKKDASNPQDCEEILSIASRQAPVDAIYNLAVVLKDGLFENQTAETFKEPFRAKAWSTKNLDKLSRRMCPQLRHFVVFSSVSCGRGNAGLSNYGMSNSVMERICENRAAEGLPALAVQWGAIGDVGIVVDMQNNAEHVMMGGTLQQGIESCLHELDGFLNQKCPVVASMVVTENRAGSSGFLNVIDTVLNIMGLKNLKSISVHTSLAELGMDSMMTVEIKQTLEREFEIFLTAQNIRELTFAKLLERATKDTMQEKTAAEVMEEEALTRSQLLIRLLGKEEAMKETCLKMDSKEERGRPDVFLIPGLEGCGAVFIDLARKIRGLVTCLQLNNLRTKHLSIPAIADELLPYILKENDIRRDFVIVGYSYGALIAIELVRKLEAESFTGTVILIDGAPLLSKILRHQHFVPNNDYDLQTNLLMGIANRIAPELSQEFLVQLKQNDSWEEKLDVFIRFVPAETLKISLQQQRNIWTCIYHRTLAFDNYDISNIPLLKSTITLLKPTVQTVKDLPADYDLSKITRGNVKCHILEGDHVTILDNPNVARMINGERIKDATAVEKILQNAENHAHTHHENGGTLSS